MIAVTGKYTSTKIFTDNVEDEALSLINGLCNHPVFEGMPIRIMPDVHAGKGIVIGFSCPIPEAVAPAHVGCDIGCSMTTIELDNILDPKDYANFEHKVKQAIPTGFNVNEKGRIMPRSAAVKKLDMETFENEMKNVYSTSICRGTLDESPMAYKDTQEIISLISPTVDNLFFVKPKINIKATDGAE